jgi:hypothetical protein
MQLPHKEAYTNIIPALNIKRYWQIFRSQNHDYRLSRCKDNQSIAAKQLCTFSNEQPHLPNRRIEDFTDLGKQTVSSTPLRILKWQVNEKMRGVL